MTTSMTAFARAARELEGGQLIWEIRSVNHRYLDINLKLPEELRALDAPSRAQISHALNRGRIDAQLKFEKSGSVSARTAVDSGAVKALIDMLTRIEQVHPKLVPATTMDILRWPGVITHSRIDSETLGENALEALAQGLARLIEHRRREGAGLAVMLAGRITRCRDIVDQLVGNMAGIQQKLRHKWCSRVGEIVQNVDQERVAQEIAILLTKSDVSEELDRLHSHFDAVEQYLKSTAPSGRNLDFLMQELNREANTLGSKSVDLEMTSAAMELKVLIDQMREQVQNIE